MRVGAYGRIPMPVTPSNERVDQLWLRWLREKLRRRKRAQAAKTARP